MFLGKIIFIHGYTSSSHKDWYPGIARLLDKKNIDYAIPDLPGGKNPKADKWLERINSEVVNTDKPLILIGHSLGTRAILLYLEKYSKKFEKVILIAPFANRIENSIRPNGESFPDFFRYKLNVNQIKSKTGNFIVVHAEDDKTIEYLQGKEIAKDLGAKLINTYGNGHFSDSSNYKYIFNILKEELHF